MIETIRINNRCSIDIYTWGEIDINLMDEHVGLDKDDQRKLLNILLENLKENE